MTAFFVITVITILMGTLCQCQDIKNEIINLKNVVESVNNDSKSWREDLFSNYTLYYQNTKNSELQDFNATVDEAYEYSRSYIAAAEKDGIDVNHCFESIESQLSNFQIIVYETIHTYMNNASKCFSTMDGWMNAILQRQIHYLPALYSLLKGDDDYEDWESPQYTEVNQWTSRQLVEARKSINSYKKSAGALKKTFPAVLMIIFSRYSDKFKSEMRDIKSAIPAVKLAGDECIRNS